MIVKICKDLYSGARSVYRVLTCSVVLHSVARFAHSTAPTKVFYKSK